MSIIEPVVSVVAAETAEAVTTEVAKGFFSNAMSAVARNPVIAAGVVAGTAAAVYGTIKLRAYRAAKAAAPVAPKAAKPAAAEPAAEEAVAS